MQEENEKSLPDLSTGTISKCHLVTDPDELKMIRKLIKGKKGGIVYLGNGLKEYLKSSNKKAPNK